jgi:hypothetical protein
MRVLKEKTPIPARLGGVAGGSGQEQNTQKNLTISSACRQGLSPRQKRCLQILLDNPGGIISSDLREKIKTNNIAQYVRALRLKGLVIGCEEEPCLIEGGPITIGRYRLAPGSYDRALDLLEVPK